MQIKGSKVLVLGGWGLVGSAICHKLMEYKPAKIAVSSLRKHEAEDAVEQLRKEYPDCDPNMFEAKWGNIFSREEWKDENWQNILNSDEMRKGFVDDVFEELDDDILHRSALYKMVDEVQPDLVIDCINTATGIAYLNIYDTAKSLKADISEGNVNEKSVETLLASSYIPQLIRHVQILYRSLQEVNSTMYLKIGTSGTGGMGLNIPYTHSEERPSRVLLSKTAVAGAQSLLHFIMARTPGNLIVKEIKPTAAIAWKRIAYDEVRKGGMPIPLVDMAPENAHEINSEFDFNRNEGVRSTGENFKSVFIDTGENGIFSKGEFTAIGSLGQMEIVTPEEIATYAVYEVRGGNTGYDVMQGLDSSTLGPTYRGGMLYNSALKKIEEIEKEQGVDSIAFELLGPPRLSKLLFEAYIVKRIAGTFEDALFYQPQDIANEAVKMINSDQALRSQMISIGLVILLPDGKKYLRGNDVKIPKKLGKDVIEMNSENLEKWCYEGWIDLRPSNFKEWQDRLNEIKKQAEEVPEGETSSRYTYTKEYWNYFETIDEGKIAGWIFEYEDKGWRFKR